MKKVYRDKKGVGPLVSSQEEIALLFPLINRLQTSCQPLILFPHSVYITFCLFVLLLGHALHEKGVQRQKGDSPLVSSQKERALLVPLINSK